MSQNLSWQLNKIPTQKTSQGIGQLQKKMKKMRTQIEATITVSFANNSNAEMFIEKMNKIQEINSHFKWDMKYYEDIASVLFRVSTYEEYMAIATKSALMCGSVSSEINLAPIYNFIDKDIEKRETAQNNRMKKNEEDALADAAW